MPSPRASIPSSCPDRLTPQEAAMTFETHGFFHGGVIGATPVNVLSQ